MTEFYFSMVRIADNPHFSELGRTDIRAGQARRHVFPLEKRHRWPISANRGRLSEVASAARTARNWRHCWGARPCFGTRSVATMELVASGAPLLSQLVRT